jgi:hypothetical protein
LEENDEDLAKLEAWVSNVHGQDRFGAPLAKEAQRAINACQEELETFAQPLQGGGPGLYAQHLA